MRGVAESMRRKIVPIRGVVDARIIQRSTTPSSSSTSIAPSGRPGAQPAEVMKNVVAALNSSIQFHKKNFWIDPVSKNNYYVGVQYLEDDIVSVETLMDIPITSPNQEQAIRSGTSRPCGGQRGHGDHAHQPPVHDRPDDGRPGARPWPRRR